ncbi:MAG: NUDIX domain-containing protein [Anaerolineae bacterium]|nr:NUDIX domain-containing protein [Anaerolineae bacterium]
MRKGAAVVLVNDRQEVLLQKREDFRIWDLPGGLAEEGEDLETTAIREAFEETGFKVALDRHIAIYRYPQKHVIVSIYRGHVYDGVLVRKTAETVDARWFSPGDLPRRLNFHVRDAVHDAFCWRESPVEVIKHLSPGEVLLRTVALAFRNFRNRVLRR